MLAELMPKIKKNTQLLAAAEGMKISNIAATCNIDVKNINLPHLARDSFFINYYKCTFAAAAERIANPWCAALIYQMGVIVSMGTKSPLEAYYACLKYIESLNNRLGVECSITGFKIDNYVCTTHLFPLDLTICTTERMNKFIEYDEGKFSGAILRCKFLKLPFHTEAVITFFSSGNINFTGLKSFEEGVCLLEIAYERFFIHLDATKTNTPRYSRCEDVKREPLYNSKITPALIIKSEKEPQTQVPKDVRLLMSQMLINVDF